MKNMSREIADKYVSAYAQGLVSKENARRMMGLTSWSIGSDNTLDTTCQWCGEEYKKGNYGDYCSRCYGER